MAVHIVMDHTGDTRHQFEAADGRAVSVAEARFMELTGAGFTAAKRWTSVQVSFSNTISPVALLKYTVGANNGSQIGNPVSPFAVSVEQNNAPFLNTTVRFLQAFNYIYDAANGFIGPPTP